MMSRRRIDRIMHLQQERLKAEKELRDKQMKEAEAKAKAQAKKNELAAKSRGRSSHTKIPI